MLNYDPDYSSETSEFKDNKVITINKGKKRVTSFGLTKAKAILAQIDEIKAFVEANDKSTTDS